MGKRSHYRLKPLTERVHDRLAAEQQFLPCLLIERYRLASRRKLRKRCAKRIVIERLYRAIAAARNDQRRSRATGTPERIDEQTAIERIGKFCRAIDEQLFPRRMSSRSFSARRRSRGPTLAVACSTVCMAGARPYETPCRTGGRSTNNGDALDRRLHSVSPVRLGAFR